jgi:hypothetical protein
MDLTWPKEVMGFEAFLVDAGLVCQQRTTETVFGNEIVQYGGPGIGVRVGSDRGVWFVEVADSDTRPGEWYDAALLRDFVLGNGEDVLTLAEQIGTIRDNWPVIVESFRPARRDDTHAQLSLLRKERAKRRFPNL